MSGRVWTSRCLWTVSSRDRTTASRRRWAKAARLHQWVYDLASWRRPHGRRLFEDLGTEPIELEGTRVIDSKDVTHVRFRPPKTPRKDGGAP